MNDNNIIKALECQLGIDDSCNCYGCLFREDKSCIDESERILEVVKDLINHQKAEIASLGESVRLQAEMLYDARTEAIKEFAERLKGELTTGSATMRVSVLNVIDSLVKEMTEGHDAKEDSV